MSKLTVTSRNLPNPSKNSIDYRLQTMNIQMC
jgi:hypothetical protein